MKKIISIICYIILFPLLICSTLVATWYILPDFQTTFLGQNILEVLASQEIFIISISLILSILLFFIIGRIFRSIRSSKILNFYTHLWTWIFAFSLAAEALFTFFVAEDISTTQFTLTQIRKISIGSGVLMMGLYGLFHKKLDKIINRKIQAYDTAKELNANGRSSVVWINTLKVIDFVFPEIILLVVLCFSFDFQVALYFIFIIISFIIPIIGNMVCDKRVKKEAILKEQEDRETTVNETAEAVVKLIKETPKEEDKKDE